MRKLLDQLRTIVATGGTVPVRLDSNGVAAAATDARRKSDEQVSSMLRAIHADLDFG
jgi:hypothetical protein